MAQVIKKYAGGGSYGTITRNGTTYKIDDSTLNQIASESEVVANALRNGKNLTISVKDDGEVSIYGLDQADLRNEGLSEKDVSRLSKKQRLLESRKLKDIRTGYTNIGNMKFSAETNDPNPPTEKKKKLDLTELLTLEYVKDDNGNISLGSSATNKRIKDRLNMYLNNLNGNWDEYLVYNTFSDKDAANSYTDSIRSKINDDFWARFNSGNLTEDDKAILKSYGIQVAKREPTKEELNKEQEELNEEEFNKGGWDYSTYKDRFTYTDGEYKLNDDVLINLLGDSTGNLWLNDDFKSWATKKGYDASWIPQGSGLFRINGKWFLGNNLDALTGNERVVFNNWVNNNRETVGGSNDLIKQYWELVNPYHKASQINGYSWSINPEDYYYDRSGQFKRDYDSPLVYDVVTPEIRKDSKNFNQFGHLLEGAANRIFVNPYTKQQYDYSIDMDPEEDMDIQSKYYSDENTNRQTAFSNYATFGDQKGKLAVVQAWGDPEAKTGWALLYNPDNKQYYWHSQNFRGEGQDLNTGIGNVSQSAIQIDPEMAKWIQQHISDLSAPELAYYIDRIIGNPFLRNFSGKKDADTGDSIADRYSLNDLIRNYNTNGYTFYINGRPVKFNFDNGGNKGLYGSGNMARHWGLVLDLDNPLEYKNGGVIKMQTGGVLYNTENKASKSSITTTSKPVRAAHKEKIIGDGTELTSADWAEIGALVGDTAALGATFIPLYGNAIGAATGIGASAASFYSDVKRDGLDWGDVGNLALNLGLDAATFLPGLGSGAKAIKIAKALKKSKSFAKLMDAARLAGLTVSGAGVLSAAVTSWDKLQNGNWTIKDIRNIINGARSYRNIGKLRTASVKGSPLEQTTLGKGNKKVTITRSELDDIRSKPKNEQVEAAKKLISSKLKISPATAEEAEVIAKADDKVKALEQLFKKKGVSLSREESNSILNSAEGSYLERINKVIGEKTPEVNVSDYFPTGFSISSSGTWYKPWSYFGKNRVKDVKFGEEDTYLNPNDANWWQYINGKRAAAIRYHNRKQKSLTPIVFGTSHPIFSPDADPESPLINNNYYYPVYYRKGGKIVKAKSGSILSYPEIGEEANRRLLLDKLGIKHTLNLPINTNKIITSNGIIEAPTNTFINDTNERLVKEAMSKKQPSLVEPFPSVGDSSEVLTTKPSEEGSPIVLRGSTKRSFNLDPKKLLDPISAIIAQGTNNKIYDEEIKGINAAERGALKTAPRLAKPSLYLGDIERGIEERIRQVQSFKTTTNDPILSMVEKMMRSRKIDDILREGNTALSSAIQRNKEIGLDIDNKMRMLENEASNHNNNVAGQASLARHNANIKRISSNRSGVWLQTLNQLRNDITLDQNERAQALSALQYINDQNAASELYNEELNKGIKYYNALYNKIKDDEDAKNSFVSRFGNSAEEYASSKAGELQRNLQTWLLSRQALANYINSPSRGLPKENFNVNSSPTGNIDWSDILNYKYTLSTTDKMAKGGSIQRYRPFNEQILLDNNKEIKKAISKMDDNLMKLLLKMLS